MPAASRWELSPSSFRLHRLSIRSAPPFRGTREGQEEVTLTGSNVAYTWAFGDGDGATGANPAHTYPAAGSYTAAVTATNGVSTLVATTPVTITNLATTEICLPLVARNLVNGPDLIVESITAGPNDVQLVIRNVGNGPATQEFWIDAYVDPDTPPTEINQTWELLGDQGLSWAIPSTALPLEAGAALTLAGPIVTASGVAAAPPEATKVPTPTPVFTPTPLPTDDDAPGTAALFGTITLRLPPDVVGGPVVREEVWTEVAWQDGSGAWHPVDGWIGPLDRVEEGVGQKSWTVTEELFGRGAFRWRIYDARSGALLAESPSFTLPTRANRSIVVEATRGGSAPAPLLPAAWISFTAGAGLLLAGGLMLLQGGRKTESGR